MIQPNQIRFVVQMIQLGLFHFALCESRFVAFETHDSFRAIRAEVAMSKWSDLQSIFQLAAGVNLGVAGIIVFFGDRFRQEEILLKTSEEVVKDIGIDANPLLKADTKLNEDHIRFTGALTESFNSLNRQKRNFLAFRKVGQAVIFALSVVCLCLLFWASHASGETISIPYLAWMGMVLLFAPVVLVALNTSSIEWIFTSPVRRQREQVRDIQKSIVDRYLEMLKEKRA